MGYDYIIILHNLYIGLFLFIIKFFSLFNFLTFWIDYFDILKTSYLKIQIIYLEKSSFLLFFEFFYNNYKILYLIKVQYQYFTLFY